MKRNLIYAAKIFLLFCFVGGGALLFSQDYDLDREELESVGDQDIEFINYVGPHDPAVLSSAAEIQDIGRIVGQRGEYYGAYRIIRAADPSEPEGLDADIFIIEASAAVDHIRNVRGMINGYLQETYGFTNEKAATLAHFITVYNAVYRSRWDDLQSRYKGVVLSHLTAETAGIALNYREWPGKTRILIPLRGEKQRGEMEKLDTSELSSEEVIEKMQEEDDRSVEVRKEMVEIREEEQERERAAIQQAEEEGREEPSRETPEDSVVEEETALNEEKTPEDSRPASEETQPASEETQPASEETQPASEETQPASEEEIQERKERLEEEEQEVREERKTIAEDENEVIEEEKAEEREARQAQVQNPDVKPFFFLSLREDAQDILGQILMADENSGKILFESEINSIRGREFLITDQGILVIAGRSDGGGVVKALILDKETLQLVKEGEDILHPESGLWQKNGQFYMVIDDGGRWVMGRFNEDLERQRKSSQAVLPYTAAVFDNDGLYVQTARGGIVKLDPSTLETQASIE